MLTAAMSDSMTDTTTAEVAAATDATLARSAAAGDACAFESIYRRHAGRVPGVIVRLVGAQGVRAEDLTQEAFVRAWQALPKFRFESAVSTWLHRLAVNVIIERFRSLAAERQRLTEGDSVLAAAAARPVRHADRLGLEAALEQLPPGAKRVFVLHDVEGYKHTEIAGLLEISVGTSKAQLHRARMLMRKRL